MIKCNFLVEKNSINNESGQTLVEFVLLITVIIFLSFTFLSGVNTGIISFWEKAGNLLVEDENITLRVL